MDITTVRYSAPKMGIGFTTEVFSNTSTQSALNIIKARIPAAQISWVRFRSEHHYRSLFSSENGNRLHDRSFQQHLHAKCTEYNQGAYPGCANQLGSLPDGADAVARRPARRRSPLGVGGGGESRDGFGLKIGTRKGLVAASSLNSQDQDEQHPPSFTRR